MVVPYRNPGELLVTGDQVQIRSIGSNALPVVVETEDLLVRQRDSANALTIPIFSIRVLVNVVSKVDDIVDGVLSARVVRY